MCNPWPIWGQIVFGVIMLGITMGGMALIIAFLPDDDDGGNPYP